jgi:hypothetical protein
LEEIDGSAFQKSGLQEIEIEEGNRHFCVLDNLLLNSDRTMAISSFGSSPEVVIPSSIETIGIRCFRERDFISTIIFESPSRVHRIEEEAFHFCSGLRSICFPASIEVIGNGSFSSCSGLSSVEFESGSQLRRIEEDAFSWSGVRSISISHVVDFIHDSAFSHTKIDDETLERMKQKV